MSSLHHVVLYYLGGGFIPKSGVFQCLEPGLFLFTLTVCTYDGKKCLLILRKNEKVLHIMFVASQTERTEVGRGQVVCVNPILRSGCFVLTSVRIKCNSHCQTKTELNSQPQIPLPH